MEPTHLNATELVTLETAIATLKHVGYPNAASGLCDLARRHTDPPKCEATTGIGSSEFRCQWVVHSSDGHDWQSDDGKLSVHWTDG